MMDEAYLLKRCIEELELAEQAESLDECTARLRACRYYGELLQAAHERERGRSSGSANS